MGRSKNAVKQSSPPSVPKRTSSRRRSKDVEVPETTDSVQAMPEEDSNAPADLFQSPQTAKRTGMVGTVKKAYGYIHEIDLTQSILRNLPPEMIGHIFFSGYFSTQHIIRNFYVISKEMTQIGATYTTHASLRCSGVGNLHMDKLLKFNFKSLRTLDLSYSVVNDRHLRDISMNLSRTLRCLSLRGTLVTNEGMPYLSSLSELRMLDLSKAWRDQKNLITDAGIQSLRTLVNLELINLSLMSISDAAICAGLQNWTRLRHLSVNCCRNIGNSTLEALSVIPLISLDISATGVTDKGFQQLKRSRCVLP
jgi:hypothetical protein